MTIHIPAWLLWTIGIAGGLVILGLAVLGACFLWWARKGLGVWQ